MSASRPRRRTRRRSWPSTSAASTSTRLAAAATSAAPDGSAPLHRQVAVAVGLRELLDRVAKHHPRHRYRVGREEGGLPRLVALAGLAEHPADGLVDEVLGV